jgi:hypothetical protein
VLRGRDDIAVGGIGDHHALAGARLDVDIVHPHTGPAEEAQASRVAEKLRVHRGGRARDDGLVSRDLLEELRPRDLGRDLFDLEPPLREIGDPLPRYGIDD